jgi:hypothetical protein
MLLVQRQYFKGNYVRGVDDARTLDDLIQAIDQEACEHEFKIQGYILEEGDQVICPYCDAAFEVVFDPRIPCLRLTRID